MLSASKQVLLPTPKQPHVQNNQPTDLIKALTGLINTYIQKTDHNSNMRLPTTTTTTTTHKQRERPRQRERIPKEGRTSRQTLKKRTTYRKNRHRQKHIQTTNTAYTINNNNNIEPQLETNQNNNDDDALVILAKHTTLTEAQKCILKKLSVACP